MYHPWRAFRALSDITLRWAHLPDGILGYADYEFGEVVLAKGMTQTERRCTIAHEVEHLLRGPVAPHMVAREEIVVDKNVARLLLPNIDEVADALAWADGHAEAAEELWVDEHTLRARLKHLHPAERGYLKSRLGDH